MSDAGAESLEEGFEFFNRGEFAAAARFFRRALRRGDRRPEVSAFLAHSLRGAGNIEQAAAGLERLLRGRPDYLPAYRALIDILNAAGRVEKAAAWAKKFLRRDPRDPQARRLAAACARRLAILRCERARELAAEKRWTRAEALLRRALRLDGASRDLKRELDNIRRERARADDSRVSEETVLRERSRALRGKGRWKEAETALRRALRSLPGRKRLRVELGDLWRERARAARKAGSFAAAEKWLRKAVKADAGRADLRRDLRDLYQAEALDLARKGRASASRRLYRRALALDREMLPKLAEPGEKFRALARQGRYREAFAVGESILDRGPTLLETRDFWNPWDWISPETLGPAHARTLDALLARGEGLPWSALYRRGFGEGASETARSFDAAVKRIEGLPMRRYGWAAIKVGQQLLIQNRLPEAERWFKISLGYRPYNWWTRGHLAEAMICMGRPDEALAQMELAVQEAPPEEKASALSWKGEIDLWLGRYREAYEVLEAACRQGAPLAWGWRGAAALQLGRLGEGLVLLDKAIKVLPQDAEAYVWRGEAHRRLGKFDEALRDLDRRPVGFWARVNRGLIHAARKDAAGLREEFGFIPAPVARFVRARLGREAATETAGMEAVLEGALRLARGFRREDYEQRSWMI